MATPSRETAKSPTTEGLEAVRTVITPSDQFDEKLPSITIQYPSPEMRDGVFEKEMTNGVKTPLANG